MTSGRRWNHLILIGQLGLSAKTAVSQQGTDRPWHLKSTHVRGAGLAPVGAGETIQGKGSVSRFIRATDVTQCGREAAPEAC